MLLVPSNYPQLYFALAIIELIKFSKSTLSDKITFNHFKIQRLERNDADKNHAEFVSEDLEVKEETRK